MNVQDRVNLRMEYLFGPEMVPVLLVYVASVTKVFLIPATGQEIEHLRMAHGTVLHQDSLNVPQAMAHRYIREHLEEWEDKYLVDQEIGPLSLPSNVILVQTGKFP